MKNKILIVEDEKLISKAYAGYLKKIGYAVEVAGDGEEGLVKAEEFAPDLILLDLKMPKLDGIETLKRLREKPKTEATQVVVLTNISSNDKVVDVLKAGSTHYLIKSDYGLEDLGEKVGELLAGVK